MVMVSNKGNGNQATVTLKSEPIKCEVSPQAKPEMPIKVFVPVFA